MKTIDVKKYNATIIGQITKERTKASQALQKFFHEGVGKVPTDKHHKSLVNKC